MAKSRKELEASLSPKKQKAAMILVQAQLSDDDNNKYKGMTKDEIASVLEISRMTLWRWENEDQDFIEYKSLVTRDVMNSFETEVMSIFKDALRQHKSFKGIELYFKYRNLLKDHTVVETISSGSKSEEEVHKEIADLEKLLNDEDE